MEIIKVDLYQYFGLKREEKATGYLTCYIRNGLDYCKDRIRPAMLVLGGGGYGYISDREKEIIALKFACEGYQTFTLEYSLNPVRFPTQLIEGLMAIAYIRENASELQVIPDKIGAIGFSAGGHLCASMATYFNCEAVKNALKEKQKLCRPDIVVLSYPVITSGEKRHEGSINAICGNDEKLRDFASIEKHVTKDNSPAFIWTTLTDSAVPCENSLMLANEYKKLGISFELHIFSEGLHGLSIATRETETKADYVNPQVQPWFELMMTFLRKNGFNIDDKDEQLKFDYFVK